VAGIARSVEIFNQAFRLALPHLAGSAATGPQASQALSEAIRRRLKLGETDPVKIAAEALGEFKRQD
jgi:hypothetical protein